MSPVEAPVDSYEVLICKKEETILLWVGSSRATWRRAGNGGAFGSIVTCLLKKVKSRLGVKRRDETQQNTNVIAAANDSAEKLYYTMSSLRWQCSVVQVDAGKKIR